MAYFLLYACSALGTCDAPLLNCLLNGKSNTDSEVATVDTAINPVAMDCRKDRNSVPNDTLL